MPMTACEAPGYVDRGWTRWVDVVAALKATVTGTSGADTLTGTDSGELLVGLDGDDTLKALGGNDELSGGAGNDRLYGGRDNDEMYGGKGSDELHGEDDDDTYAGGPGADDFVFDSSETGDKILTDFSDGDDRIVLTAENWPAIADIFASEVQEPDGYYVYTLLTGLTVETDVQSEADDFAVEEA